MIESGREPTAVDRERSLALIAAVEARMRQAETFTWAVPGLALTGQAFLLTIALDDDKGSGVRAIAAAAGLVVLGAALHFLGKHTFNFDMFEAVLERERIKLGHHRVTRSHLLQDIASFPEDTLLRQREWWEDEHRARRLNWLYRPWAKLRNRLLVDTKAVWVWSSALGILSLLDLGVLVDALVELV